jgi:hypothetical protein
MNLLTPRRVGAPDNNDNGRGRKGKTYSKPKKKKGQKQTRSKGIAPLYDVFN